MPIDITRARAELRRQALLDALYDAYPGRRGAGQLVDAMPDDVAATLAELGPEIAYLVDAELAAAEESQRRSVPILRLTAAGVDHVERERELGERLRGDVRMRRMLRLRCLQALNWVYPSTARPIMVQRLLADDLDLDLSDSGMAGALAYLADANLAREEGGYYKITPAGIDYLGAEPSEAELVPGVATPLPPSP